MFKRTLIVSLACLCSAAAPCQCLPRDSVHRRMAAIKNSAQPAAVQLNELLRLEKMAAACPYSADSTHELLLRRIAILYLNQSDFTNAARYLERACNIIVARFATPSVNSAQVLTNYYFLSNIYDSLHNATKKRWAEQQCIDFSLRWHTPADIAAVRSLYAQVEYLFDIGDYQRCRDDAQRCERLANQYAAGTTGAQAAKARLIAESSHGWCVNALLQLQDFDQAGQLLADKAAEYKKNRLTGYLAFTNTELAELELHKGNHQKALEYFNLALRYYKADGKEFDYKQTLKSMGEELWFNYYHDAPKALACYRAALQHNRPLAERTRLDSIEDASIWNNIANAYVQLGRFDSAFASFRRAFDQVKPGIDETGILHSSEEDWGTHKKLHYLAGLLIDKGDACRKKFAATADKAALNEATRIYRVADQLLGRLNTGRADLHSRLFWRADTRRLYEHAIDVCYLQGNPGNAFYFFEKSRAALLNDQLAEQWMQGGDAIARQAMVKRKLLQLGRELEATGPGTAMHTFLSNALYAARQELDSLGEQIKRHNPLYYQGFLDSSYTTLGDLRGTLLSDHASLLEIFYGDSAVYTLLATNGHVWLDRVDKTAYDNAVASFLAHLGNDALLNSDFGGYTRVAHTLFTLVFNHHPLPPGRMIVSPDGRSFPLEALVTDAAAAEPAYLLYQHAVSYTYSARYLQNNFAAGAVTPEGNFLGVAPVQYKGTRLATLEGSDASLEHIGRYFGSALNLVTAAATRESFRRAFSGYRFIQLYTHSSDSSDRKEPVIYFADSVLYLSDLIPENKPAAQLIVLSACQTGIGRFYRGEGVFSFNRGFAALGIPSSVSNLWSIDNNSTYRITELFYKYLADGLPVDIALQKAKLQFIKTSDSREKKLPYYWAASILIGKTNAIDFPRPFNWMWVAYGASILLLLFFLYRAFFKRRHSNT